MERAVTTPEDKNERDATLRELIAEVPRPLWRSAANARLDELEASIRPESRTLSDAAQICAAENRWMGCGECDAQFICHNGEHGCIRLYRGREDRANTAAPVSARSLTAPHEHVLPLIEAKALLKRVIGPSFFDNTLQGRIEDFLKRQGETFETGLPKPAPVSTTGVRPAISDEDLRALGYKPAFDYGKAYADLFDLINNDAYAVTFQSLGQYRSWLLQSIRTACPDAPASTGSAIGKSE